LRLLLLDDDDAETTTFVVFEEEESFLFFFARTCRRLEKRNVFPDDDFKRFWPSSSFLSEEDKDLI